MKSTCRHSAFLSLTLLALAASPPALSASPASPAKVQYDAAKKTASERYNGDLDICAQERTSAARMQCKRDASSEYRGAMAEAKARLDEAKKTGVTSTTTTTTTKPVAAASCKECGKVIAINSSERTGKGGPLGVIAGGVAGAVLGHQVGKGTGKDVATIAGAAGGAYAGHKIEERMTATRYWTVSVRFDNGDERTYEFQQAPQFAVGDAVKASDGSIVRQ